ncbi:hypothetical protein [Acidithiobacillus sp. HP-11]|uniref:hypothetical protein n=1 Tax=Acidithiobacillus sp. HP-11 TaxID=2697656 RepID=UPI00187A6914|nr:hypothetical protein [Acidithiobacillus sp. HP-11]MBE7567482.1 hypothetical protein [Acidithiobacillus sp. HP-11]
MKGLIKVYPFEVIEWTKKDTGEFKRMWKQSYDLDQGNGLRPLQSDFMFNADTLVWPVGDYEIEFFLEKDRRGFIDLKIASKRLIKSDSRPQAVAN